MRFHAGSMLNFAERRGRHTVHTQMDFVLGFVFVPIVCALTLGQLGSEEFGQNFFEQLRLAPVRCPASHLLSLHTGPSCG